jgi:hypothetical protein
VTIAASAAKLQSDPAYALLAKFMEGARWVWGDDSAGRGAADRLAGSISSGPASLVSPGEGIPRQGEIAPCRCLPLGRTP